MKIKANVLGDFLSAVLTGGSTTIGEVILDFTKEGLKIIAQVAAQTVYIEGLLKKEAFDDYEAVGQLGIRDLGQLIDYIKGIDDKVGLNRNEDTLTIKSKMRRVTAKLVDPEYIEKIPQGILGKIEPLVADNKFKIDVKSIKDFFNYVRAVGATELRMGAKDNKVYLQTKSEDSVVEKLETKISKSFDITLGVNFIDAISNLNGAVTIGANTDKPIVVTNETELSKVIIAIVPIVKEK